MSDCKQFYNNICKEINRSDKLQDDKLQDFERIFSVKQDSENKNVKQTFIKHLSLTTKGMYQVNQKSIILDIAKLLQIHLYQKVTLKHGSNYNH